MISVSGWTGEQIDADPTKQLSLRFRHVRVSRSNQDIHRSDRFGSERHCANRLDTAKAIDFVGTAQMHCGDNGIMRPAIVRRRAGNNTFHAGDLCRHHTHMRRGNHRIATARDVTTYAVNGNILVAKHDTGKSLFLDVLQGGALYLGKFSDLRLSKLDVVKGLLGNAANTSFDLLIGKAESSPANNYRSVPTVPGPAASPRALISLMIPSTVVRTSVSIFFSRICTDALFQHPDHESVLVTLMGPGASPPRTT